MRPSSEADSPNPFPGLRSYETQDAPWFFGRDADIDALQTRVEAARFVAVVGASGSGKSSIVKAGLVPALNKADAGPWYPAIFRPGIDPIGEMAGALAVAAGEPGGGKKRAIETTLRRSSLGLVDVIEGLAPPANGRILVVVDQFDEVFRFKEITRTRDNGDEAVAFVNLLIEAARDAETAACIILTMRSDFLGRCEEFRGLPEVVSGGMYLIPRLTRSGLRAAIEGPIERARAAVTPRLVQQLLNDIGDAPDQLPVLQHALMRTWDQWRGTSPDRPMDLDDYTAIGGMREALSRHADSVLATLTDDAQRDIAEVLFKGLTERGRDGNETRRPTPLGEIAAVAESDLKAVAAVVEQFRAPGCTLLIAPPVGELASDSVIDISHESLIRLWARLREWITEEADEAEHYLRVAKAAVLHQTGNQSLYRDPELLAASALFARVNEAWADRYHPEFQLANAFLVKSREERDRDFSAGRIDEPVDGSIDSESAATRHADEWDLWGPLEERYRHLAEAGGPYKMLSIDGGGVRTLISIGVLTELESMLGNGDPSFRLCQYFDLIGGTSTGAVVAAMLARGGRMTEVAAFFQDLAREMFVKRSILSRWKSLYEAGGLETKLKEVFGAQTDLRTGNLETILLVVTRNATTDSAWPLMSNPWGKYNHPARRDCNLRIPLWQLVRASTAAPVYFPPEVIQLDPDDPTKRFVFIDGGTTPYYNPAFLMARMATEPLYRLSWPRGERSLLIVSVGSGVAPSGGATADEPEQNLAAAAVATLNGLLSAALTDQDLSCRTMGRCSYGLPLDREVGDLVLRDDAGHLIPLSADAGRDFLYVRYDVLLTSGGLHELGVGDVNPSRVALQDCVDALDDLSRIGEALARQVNPEHFGSFWPLR